MNAIASVPTDADGRRNALVQRLFEAAVGTWDLLAVYLGSRLGFYRAFAERGSLTSFELAEVTGTHERYVREMAGAASSERDPRCGGHHRSRQPALLPPARA